MQQRDKELSSLKSRISELQEDSKVTQGKLTEREQSCNRLQDELNKMKADLDNEQRNVSSCWCCYIVICIHWKNGSRLPPCAVGWHCEFAAS